MAVVKQHKHGVGAYLIGGVHAAIAEQTAVEVFELLEGVRIKADDLPLFEERVF